MTDRPALGHVLDIILLLVAAEGAGLALLHRLAGRGPPPAAIMFNLAAGASLLLAVRLAVSASPALPIAACLLAALVCHALDLRQRWPARPK